MTLVTSADGLSFSDAQAIEHEGGSGPFDDRCRVMPDAKTVRCYHWPHNKGQSEVTSVSSTDGGKTYSADAGVRDVYLTYIQGMGNGESVAIAKSTDGGMSFTKVGRDIFPHGTYPYDADEVDQTVLPMRDGTLRYFVMVPGQHRAPRPGEVACCNVTSYTLPAGGDPAKDWEWDGYAIDPAAQPLQMGGASYRIWSLNDPHAVELADGRVRVYVNALLH
eukprot:gene9711-6298_t